MWQVSICVSAEAEDAVSRLLEETFGIPASVYCDARTRRSIVSVYPSSLRATSQKAGADLRFALRRLALGKPGARSARVIVKKIRRENWALSWRRHFKPIEIGGSLLVKPGWSRRRPRPGQRVVVIDPGLSFGTGHHATTSFCLAQLAACRRADFRQSFLDIGTGSGILAIAAAKLGYSPVDAFDFDPESIRVSRQNARKNRVHARVEPKRRDLTQMPFASPRRRDVICANLMADLLASQAGKICARLNLGGRLIVAGILSEEFPGICEIFVEFGLTLEKSRVDKEWQSGRFILLPGK